jgi:hypothetical protein
MSATVNNPKSLFTSTCWSISFCFDRGSVNVDLLVEIETSLDGDTMTAKSFSFAFGGQTRRGSATSFQNIHLAAQLGAYCQHVDECSKHH